MTANDLAAGDPDSGPNGLQNFPVLSFTESSASNTTVHVMLGSAPNTAFRIDFFSNTTADPAGYGEGQTFLSSATMATDSHGNLTFNIQLPRVPFGQFITATATDPSNDTSERSEERRVGKECRL